MLDKRLFHYNTLKAYNSYLYDTLLYDHHIVTDTMVEVEVRDGLAQGYFAKKDRTLYMIDKNALKDLPIRIKGHQEELDGKKVFHLINDYKSFRIVPEKTMGFKQLIDTLSNKENTNPDDWKLAWIIGLASYCSRTFIRLSTNPGFGKDSIKNTLHNLTGKVNNIKPRSIPGVLKELTPDGEVVLNESSGMKKEIRDLIQEIILQLGDGSVTYANGALRSGAHNTKDKYDVHKLSITAMFNRLEDYNSPEDFFDYQFANNTAIKDRLLPIRLSGLLVENFKLDFDYNALMLENKEFLGEIIKNIEYWKVNHLSELKPFVNPTHDIKGRHAMTLNVLFSFINLYSESQEEYTKWCNLLLKKIRNYEDAIKGSLTCEEPLKTEEIIINDMAIEDEHKSFLDKWEEEKGSLKCLQDFLDAGYSEADVEKMREEGIIVRFKPDSYGLI